MPVTSRSSTETVVGAGPAIDVHQQPIHVGFARVDIAPIGSQNALPLEQHRQIVDAQLLPRPSLLIGRIGPRTSVVSGLPLRGSSLRGSTTWATSCKPGRSAFSQMLAVHSLITPPGGSDGQIDIRAVVARRSIAHSRVPNGLPVARGGAARSDTCRRRLARVRLVSGPSKSSRSTLWARAKTPVAENSSATNANRASIIRFEAGEKRVAAARAAGNRAGSLPLKRNTERVWGYFCKSGLYQHLGNASRPPVVFSQQPVFRRAHVGK